MTTDDTTPTTAQPETPARDRLDVAKDWLTSASRVSLQIIAVCLLLALVGYILGKLWAGVMPVALALLFATVLWPAVAWLRRHGVGDSAAAALMTVTGILVVVGVVAGIVPSVVSQADDIGHKAAEGITKAKSWLQGPPFNIGDDQISKLLDTLQDKVKESSGAIAHTAVSGVSTATSTLMMVFTVLILVFFFLKDGSKFLPWLRRTTGDRASGHLADLLGRIWATLSGFIRTQAIVSFIDALFIGAALFVLKVPLAGVLTIITFIAGFVPIVGAVVAGALAVLIALVGKSWIAAAIMLVVILVVQQIEGNVLQPWLQAKVMELHAAVVLLAVLLGGSMWGITGAFLAVPVAATIAVVFRYTNEQLARKAGEAPPPDTGPVEV
ncbi:AI-2E family transporter [Gordonia sp. X0973]|uniref:AI-2E family transporter n=1 Tax=Gordonia sp. X0973 TaxID=2742602 RepID=UPI000F51E851|nr:AI-2E family transporter [Gordonia sp. X0973]QKT07979.1 AI-2E family transporter [Gordonia sp. X0973]